MAEISTVCVYCGSREGRDGEHARVARALGHALVAEGWGLVYGGGRVGLMGILADAVLARGGHVTGIIPAHLHDWEVGHEGLSELLVVDSMHERKRAMFERSDAFIVLPGGLGTLEEAFEIITWRQLHLHDKPVIMLDHNGYWQPWSALIEHVIAADFASASTKRLFAVASGVDEAIRALKSARAPAEPAAVARL